jgi:hypothetical protein
MSSATGAPSSTSALPSLRGIRCRPPTAVRSTPPGVPRGLALRHSTSAARSRDDGQMPAVNTHSSLGAQQAARARPAGRPDLPARGRRARRGVRCRPPATPRYWVGSSTVATLMANAVVPGLLDRYLGRTGSPQQTGERAPTAGQPVKEPADGGRAGPAPGAFDDRAHAGSASSGSHRYPRSPARSPQRSAAWPPGRWRAGDDRGDHRPTGSRTSGVLAALWGIALLSPPPAGTSGTSWTAGFHTWRRAAVGSSVPGTSQGVLRRSYRPVPAAWRRRRRHARGVDVLARGGRRGRRRRPAVVSGVAAWWPRRSGARRAGVATAGGGHRPVDAGSRRPQPVRVPGARDARSAPGAPGDRRLCRRASA